MNKLEQLCEELNASLLELEDALRSNWRGMSAGIPFWVEKDATKVYRGAGDRWELGKRSDGNGYLLFDDGKLWVEVNGEKEGHVTSAPRSVRIALTDALPALVGALRLQAKFQKDQDAKSPQLTPLHS